MKTFTFTILLSVAVAILVVGRQRKEVLELRGQTDSLKEEISKLDGAEESPEQARARSARQPVDENRRSGKGGRRISKVEVEELRTKLVNLLEGKNLNARPREMVATYEAILKTVAHCRSDDLIAVVEGWEGAENQGSEQGMLSMILQMLALEQDPYRVLAKESEGSQQDQQMKSMAVAALARQDAVKAGEWLREHGDSLAQFARDRVYSSVAMKLLRVDPDAAVELFSGQNSRDRKRTLAMLAGTGLTPMKELGARAHEVKDEQLRRDLLSAAVGAALTHQGIEEAQGQLDRVEDPQDYEAAVIHAATMALDSRPDEVMGWLLGGEKDSAEAKAVRGTMTTWARRDFRAAAEWLGEREPSGRRDAAIQGLTQAVRKLDPKAATIWATEISDPDLRTSMLEVELNYWKSVDAGAAQKWEDERSESE